MEEDPVKISPHVVIKQDFPAGSDGKESTCNAVDLGLIPGFNGEWLPTPVFLPGEFQV